MIHILRLILTQMVLSLRSRAELQVENLALRHQIEILKRTVAGQKFPVWLKKFPVMSFREFSGKSIEFSRLDHMNRQFTGHTVGLEVPVRRMISIVPCPSADRSTIRERQPTFRDVFRSATSRSNRVRSSGHSHMHAGILITRESHIIENLVIDGTLD